MPLWNKTFQRENTIDALTFIYLPVVEPCSSLQQTLYQMLCIALFSGWVRKRNTAVPEGTCGVCTASPCCLVFHRVPPEILSTSTTQTQRYKLCNYVFLLFKGISDTPHAN